MSEAPSQPDRRYIRQAWLVILLGICYGGALAGVQTTLGPKIAENKRNETYDRIPQLVPGADKEKTVELEVTDSAGKPQRVYRALAADGSHVGWVLPAGGQGFADRIDLLIGLNADVSTITGLYVLDQKETPGLGDYITGDDFLSRFRDKPADQELVVVKMGASAPNEILAITGATISSDSVANIVNQAVATYKEPIRQLPVDGK